MKRTGGGLLHRGTPITIHGPSSGAASMNDERFSIKLIGQWVVTSYMLICYLIHSALKQLRCASFISMKCPNKKRTTVAVMENEGLTLKLPSQHQYLLQSISLGLRLKEYELAFCINSKFILDEKINNVFILKRILLSLIQ